MLSRVVLFLLQPSYCSCYRTSYRIWGCD